MFSSLTCLVLTTLVSVAIAARPQGCTVSKTGTLSATVNNQYKSFTSNEYGQVSYREDQTNPLDAEFLVCENMVDPGREGIDFNGVIYVPSQDKCIQVLSTNDETGPYFTQLSACGTGYDFKFALIEDTELFWIGASDIEGTIIQGGCVWLGYQTTVPWGTYDLTKEPITHGRGAQIALTCGAPAPAPIGAYFSVV